MKPLDDKLYSAIKDGDLDLCKDLLRRGANASAIDDDKWTPLHCAAWKGFKDACRILIEFGASPTAVDKEGYSPMHWAIKGGEPNLIRYFVEECGVSIDSLGPDGETLEQLATKSGWPASVPHIAAYRNSLKTEREVREALGVEETNGERVRNKPDSLL